MTSNTGAYKPPQLTTVPSNARLLAATSPPENPQRDTDRHGLFASSVSRRGSRGDLFGGSASGNGNGNGGAEMDMGTVDVPLDKDQLERYADMASGGGGGNKVNEY